MTEPKTVSVELVLPTDEQALGLLDQLVQDATIKGSLATNVLALRGWIGDLGQRLGVVPAERPTDINPVTGEADAEAA